MAEVIDKEEGFCFSPYTCTPMGIIKAQLFGELNEEINLVPLEACSLKALTLPMMMAPTLLPCKLESGECISVYNPQRVLQQLKYD